ncbi:MAG TPA: hypothetical protein VL172_04770 [Kofleriaceae bacterium]|nr:hypothetical protein [Kofleriaceae bacterium]
MAVLALAGALALILVRRNHAESPAPDQAPPSAATTAAKPRPALAAAEDREPASPPAASPATAPAPGSATGVASFSVAPGPPPPPLVASAPPAAPSAPYPAGLSAAEERAMRIRHLLELRERVSAADARLATGDDDGGKLRAARDEDAARQRELETWATAHAVSGAELERAGAELERQRAAAVPEPPRPR